eukprot:CAMPEP_0206481534 /NCGR_PEP_ID=MMETSP0324_2-20121206/38217_1 /ASSEMBLY_ACC=CAM_ASM_000836 /TAXON_ID=2866 /ORGANISM="Crypthecodinium cohnii, Strain Seligo" /LENGTH=211 /DNA_ID=CAMNT_0053959071 /DNA_START=154 /DNA_END=787 /DNA_ORIENTATION=-
MAPKGEPGLNQHQEKHQMSNLIHGPFLAQTLERSPSPSFGCEARSKSPKKVGVGPGRYDPYDPQKQGTETYNWPAPKWGFGKEKRQGIENSNGFGGKFKNAGKIGPAHYDLSRVTSLGSSGPVRTQDPQWKFGSAERRHHSCTANNNPWISTHPRSMLERVELALASTASWIKGTLAPLPAPLPSASARLHESPVPDRWDRVLEDTCDARS